MGKKQLEVRAETRHPVPVHHNKAWEDEKLSPMRGNVFFSQGVV